MNSRDEVRNNRRRLRKEYRNLYDALSEILFRHDPIGINFETNTDEYEPEVDTILPRLKRASSHHEVRKIIHEEFVHWFNGEDTAGPESRYEDVAREVWSVYKLYSE